MFITYDLCHKAIKNAARLTGLHWLSLSAATNCTFMFRLCDLPRVFISFCRTWWKTAEKNTEHPVVGHHRGWTVTLQGFIQEKFDFSPCWSQPWIKDTDTSLSVDLFWCCWLATRRASELTGILSWWVKWVGYSFSVAREDAQDKNE